MTLFVTHYPLLANLSACFPREVGNYHMAFMNVRRPRLVTSARHAAGIAAARRPDGHRT